LKRDWRSPEAAEYRKLYNTRIWRKLRDRTLLRDGYRCQRKGCGVMLTRGRSHPRSAVVHHVDAHKGNRELFYDINNLQAVCWQCHSTVIQSEEFYGYSKEVGNDGWPVDLRHRFHKSSGGV